jgi:hypothetical protein
MVKGSMRFVSSPDWESAFQTAWHSALQNKEDIHDVTNCVSDILVRNVALQIIHARSENDLSSVYRLLREAQEVVPSAALPEIKMVSVRAAKYLMEGILLSLQGKYSRKPDPAISKDLSGTIEKVAAQFKAGLVSEAQETFSGLCKEVLEGRASLPPLFSIKIPVDIPHRLRQWACSLEMLKSEMDHLKERIT